MFPSARDKCPGVVYLWRVQNWSCHIPSEICFPIVLRKVPNTADRDPRVTSPYISLHLQRGLLCTSFSLSSYVQGLCPHVPYALKPLLPPNPTSCFSSSDGFSTSRLRSPSYICSWSLWHFYFIAVSTVYNYNFFCVIIWSIFVSHPPDCKL